MTRLDSARETAAKTRDTAAHLADGAKQRLGPALDTVGPKAAQAAHSLRVQYDRHLAPQIGHAFASLPPDAQQNALKALHRAQEAALAARLSATRAADQARSTVGPRVAQAVEDARAAVVPVAQEAQTRGAAAITALHGHVTSAEISDLAARNIRKEQRNGWAAGLAVAGAVAIGSGVLAWQWWRRHSNPEWLVEPPAPQGSQPAGAHATGTTPAPVNGSGPEDAAAEPEPKPESRAETSTPKPGSPPGRPADDDRPKPHDPRKPH
ncbi:DUF5324 family protein [Streptomyces kaniharaensis]|uniref:DUF5324 family protein n=1 Tax=Streptomyces kaniharaensis TaxID=212423 RepID=UPI00129521E5|nr:DUF5324 family protein [Streptomyces kaniharaensis]